MSETNRARLVELYQLLSESSFGALGKFFVLFFFTFLESLESTQEARVALGYIAIASSNSYASLISFFPNF